MKIVDGQLVADVTLMPMSLVKKVRTAINKDIKSSLDPKLFTIKPSGKSIYAKDIGSVPMAKRAIKSVVPGARIGVTKDTFNPPYKGAYIDFFVSEAQMKTFASKRKIK